MADINNAKFIELCDRFAAIDLMGDGPPAPPSDFNLEQAIRNGAWMLPWIYQEGYAEPLLDNLLRVLILTMLQNPPLKETLTGAVYEHIPGSEVQKQLQRFLAVISNLYRSFLSKTKRAAADIRLTSITPPLAVFQSTGRLGPFTMASDAVIRLFGTNIGVVSLPSTYRDHPVLWASLAHETGGHDVTHADKDLLPELATEVRELFGVDPLDIGQPPTERQLDGLLWSYWIDEAVADVYGILNIGPAFAWNLAALLAAITKRFGETKKPLLITRSGPLPNSSHLNTHPTDILRLHVAIGAIENLNQLSATTGSDYVKQLEDLARLCAEGGDDTITIQGDIQIERDRWLPVDTTRPLDTMQRSARLVGAFIATARLQALDNHSIQDVETWDDADESIAQKIKTTFQGTASVVDMGDDAQLLAGATLALLAQPDLYDTVTTRLAQALDRSFERDPIWGIPSPDLAFIRPELHKPEAPERVEPRPPVVIGPH